jgi:hypothetical protein
VISISLQFIFLLKPTPANFDEFKSWVKLCVAQLQTFKGFYVFMGVMCMPNPKTYEQTFYLVVCKSTKLIMHMDLF